MYFVDLDKRIQFKFKQALSLLGYPALIWNASSHNYLLERVFKCFRHEYVPLKYSNERDTLSIVRFVKKSNVSFNLMIGCKKIEARNYSSEKLNCTLNYLTNIEMAELNLLDINDKQKMSVVDNFNKNLKNLRLVFFQPISFLLYVGKRFVSYNHWKLDF